jgi:hypothetical protein
MEVPNKVVNELKELFVELEEVIKIINDILDRLK